MSAIIVDDRDPGISYNANHWFSEASPQEFNGTSTSCSTPGGTATYQFDGADSISVWGTIESESSNPSSRSSYSLDDETPVVFTPAPQGNRQFRVKFFDFPVSPGLHTLVISTLDHGFYYLDFIQLVPHANPPPPPPPPPPNTVITQSTISPPSTQTSSRSLPVFFKSNIDSSSETSTSRTLITLSSNPSIPSSTVTSTSPFSSMPSGMTTVFVTTTPPSATSPAIPGKTSPDTDPAATSHRHTAHIITVGSTLGSLAFFAMILGVILYMFKRKRQRSSTLSGSLQQQAVSPFVLAGTEATGSVSSESIQADDDTEPPRYSNVCTKSEETPQKGMVLR